METYKIAYTKRAEKDIAQYRRAGSEEEIRKLDELLTELAAHPLEGRGKVEELHDDMEGKYSRRISHEDRLVYDVDSKTRTVTVVSARHHYQDH